MRSAMAAVHSYRYTGKVSEIRGNTTMTSASLSGEWAVTDQQYMKIETDQGFTERITLDGRMFIRESSNGGVWRERQVTVVGTGNIKLNLSLISHQFSEGQTNRFQIFPLS